MKNILCVGIVTCDTLLKGVNYLPKPGDALGLKGVEAYVGGCAGNAAIDLARLGLPVMLGARIGNDRYGQVVTDILNEYQEFLNTDGLIKDEKDGTTFSAVCIHDSGERSILTYLGATFNFCRNDILKEQLEQCDIFFVAGALLLNGFEGPDEVALLKELREQGKFTAMDTCYDTDEVWLPKIKDAVKYLDLFMPSLNEAEKLSGCTDVDEMVDFFMELGARNVVIKLGEEGAYVCEQGKERFVSSALCNDNVVDTTGAGDAFCAGFLGGLAMGWDYARCAKLGNAMGYQCVGSMGPQTGILPLNEMEKIIADIQ